MAIDLTVMRKRLEEKQAEMQQHIATLIGSPVPPEDAIQASTGVVEPEEEAVDLQEIDVDQALLALELSYSRTLNSTGRMRRRNVQRFLCRLREAA
jgi:hypothetical protein